ncbi:MAG: tetratricopeptide repeat protein [Blastocatellia bacterium]
MAKRGSRRGKPSKAQVARKAIYPSLYEADKLIESEKYLEARNALQELDRRFPDNEDVLRKLTNACHGIRDMRGYQYAIERVSKLAPDEPDAALGLAGAYMTNLKPVLALRAFRRFLERWPGDERAAGVVETIATLKRVAFERLSVLGFTEEEFDELGAMHDETQVMMEYGRYAEARRVAEKLIERKPRFASARNNLSLTYALEGDLKNAIAVARETLEMEPDNYHTLGNLVRFHVQLGQVEQARACAERLKPIINEEMVDVWWKKIEALSYLGDDDGVVAVFNQARESAHRDALKHTPEVFHLTAVAEMRLGNEEGARKLWRQTLEISPGSELAQANLEDLNKPVAERHAPWPFSHENWMPRQQVDDLVEEIKSASKRGGDKAASDAAGRYFDQHPELKALVPILLDRGDPVGREFAMRLASLVKTTGTLEALRDFALGQRGPDQMRFHAARIAREEGLMPEGQIRFWAHGKWQNIIQTTNEIHFEPLFEHGPEVSKLLKKGIERAREGDGAGGERFFKQALELEPDSPDILNNLASAYSLQGRLDEGDRIIRQIHQRHPDYLFGITNLARIHIHNGELNEAAELLKPLMSRKRLHHDELIAIVETNIELHLAKDDPESARVWLNMWEQADPDHPRLEQRRLQIELKNLPQSLRRYLERNS